MADADTLPKVIDWINAGSTIAIALAAIVSAILTCYLYRENRLLRKAGTEPEVVTYLAMDSRNNGAIDFVMSNIGQGPAMKVKFSLDMDHDDVERHDIILANQPDRKPVSVLPQSERFRSFLGMSHLLLQEPKLKPFKVTIKYENIRGDRRGSTHLLDVSQFDGYSWLGKPPEVKIADSLEKIERILRSSARISGRLGIETVTSNEAQRARQQAIEDEDRRQQQDASETVPAERTED